ncbi:MAG: S41 family peptidase [Anaerolineales bacterium]|jgi:carboxyl-terminal processing protease|nr:S41 family peptidase [Anaerolineales bacterium]
MKFIKYLLIALVGLMLLTVTFSGGLALGYFANETGFFQSANSPFPLPGLPAPLATPAGATESTPGELQTLFKPFWEAWDLVHTQYVDQPVDDLGLMRGAIRGMLAALGDQHTSYMDPEEFIDANASLEGSYEGIGAYVDTSGDYLTIVSPIKNSPSEAAGLRPGDKIIAIDGEDMFNIPPELARRRVLGPAGSIVTLTIMREGEPEPLLVEITRAEIIVASIEHEMLENGIGYVKINTFGDTTATELRSALKELMAAKPRGLIVDLRNNGGGYLQTAVQVVSQFIPKGVVLIEKYGDGRADTYEAQSGGLATEIPLVVLVNEGTASASEIVAGAIQDYERGKLVGMTTYGKGSVQIWSPLSDNQGAVRVTIAKWLTPLERAIHEIGLKPDVEIELTEEDFLAKLDPQLDKAIEVLEQIIATTAAP